MPPPSQKPTTLPPATHIPLRHLKHAASWETIVSDYSLHDTPPPRHSPPLHVDHAGTHFTRDRDIAQWITVCRPAKPLAQGQAIVLVPANTQDPIAGTIGHPKRTTLRTVEFWLETTPGKHGDHTITAPLRWCAAPWWARTGRYLLQPFIHDDPAKETAPNGFHCLHLLSFYRQQALNPTIQYTSFLLTD
ncbi:hypothetical protein FA95DRAFT_1597375 [Auriscalpium vulgare]|uniref:Uncharacterized protein n=1 Tax=Auriscalpium vulgare TaxID=40419 RepID=A0ACB8RKR9_9AGAM|nr:hypothetical protein FA95DRAFT_1597375 [Auriscalpium vulgare]